MTKYKHSPQLKGDIFEYPEKLLPEMDKVIFYLQNGGSKFLQHFCQSTLVLIYGPGNVSSLYLQMKEIFLKEEFINPLSNNDDKHWLTQRGKNFHGFVKEKSKAIRRKSWFLRNDATNLKWLIATTIAIFAIILTALKIKTEI